MCCAAVLFVAIALTACERERDEPAPATPVKTEIAKRSSFTPTITLLGVIRAAQSIPVTAQQHGTIRYPRRFANGLLTGARVTRGETLAEIINDDLKAAETEARLEMEAAAADFERAERSYRQGVISSAEHSERGVRSTIAKERYAAASKRLSTARVTAAASGTLVVTRVYPGGTVVDGSTVLAEIATAGAPMVECTVAASERPLLQVGLSVALTTRGNPPWSGGARIAEVSGVVSESGTARVVAVITATIAPPPPGTGVEAVVELPPRGSVLTVPEDAIVAGTDGPALFVAATTEGALNRFRVKRVPVVTGGRANGRVEIMSGLQDGERVIVTGVDALTDDAIASEASDKASQ